MVGKEREGERDGKSEELLVSSLDTHLLIPALLTSTACLEAKMGAEWGGGDQEDGGGERSMEGEGERERERERETEIVRL